MENGWMIEKQGIEGQPKWWNGKPYKDGKNSWTYDSNTAIRFSRNIDAECCAIAQGYSLSRVVITFHQWD